MELRGLRGLVCIEQDVWKDWVAVEELEFKLPPYGWLSKL